MERSMEEKDLCETVIDVEKIMESIRAEIKEKGYTPDMLSFNDVKKVEGEYETFNYQELRFQVTEMNHHCVIPWYRDLYGNKIKQLFKKIIRKLISFIIAPMSEEQTRYNVETVRAMNQMVAYIEQQNEKIELYEKQIQTLEMNIAAIKKGQ